VLANDPTLFRLAGDQPLDANGQPLAVPPPTYAPLPPLIPLRYGTRYEFRCRFADLTGGGPDWEADPIRPAPAPVAEPPAPATPASDGATEVDLAALRDLLERLALQLQAGQLAEAEETERRITALPGTAPLPAPLARRLRRERAQLARLRGWGQRIAATVLPDSSEAKADRQEVWLFDELQTLLEESRAQRGGEISARTRAQRIAAAYRAADTAQRTRILVMIASEFTPDREPLDSALAAMRAATNDAERGRAEAQMRVALDAPRAKFLTQFNLLPEGVKFLVDLRADLLGFLDRETALEVLQVEMDGLLESWFDPGFLELRRITWQSPALVLEKLIAYEAVHPIESWDDLRNRLDLDRRCYAFFHPRMPNEPLIFVEIALLKGLPENVQVLLDQRAPVQDLRAADTAVFYSISNAQKGLHGISLGNLLLKRVIEDLRRDLPWLKTFATLSPLPGFRKWIDQTLAVGGGPLDPTIKLWRMSDGALLRTIPATTNGVMALACSPDGGTLAAGGEWLIYNSGNPRGEGVWKVRPDGTGAEQLAPGALAWPEVSPDGRYVAYLIVVQRDVSVIRFVRVADGAAARMEIRIEGTSGTLGRCRWMPGGWK